MSMQQEEQTAQRGGNDMGALKRIVERHSAINAKLKELKMEQKDLEDGAWEKCGMVPKAVKQLSKEAAWDEVKRERQNQLEDQVDMGRKALGILVDTPLGQAELARIVNERKAGKKGNGRSRHTEA